MGDNVNMAWVVDEVCYDVIFCFVWCDYVWIVGLDKVVVVVFDVGFDFNYVLYRNVFCNIDDYFNVGISCFYDCIICKSWWYKNDRSICVCIFNGICNSIENWFFKVFLIVFFWCDVFYEVGVIFDYLFGME